MDTILYMQIYANSVDPDLHAHKQNQIRVYTIAHTNLTPKHIFAKYNLELYLFHDQHTVNVLEFSTPKISDKMTYATSTIYYRPWSDGP